jgi:hypothetical protein
LTALNFSRRIVSKQLSKRLLEILMNKLVGTKLLGLSSLSSFVTQDEESEHEEH